MSGAGESSGPNGSGTARASLSGDAGLPVPSSAVTVASFPVAAAGSMPNASASGPVQNRHSSSGVEKMHVPVWNRSLSRKSSVRHVPGSTWTMIAPVGPIVSVTGPPRPSQTGG